MTNHPNRSKQQQTQHMPTPVSLVEIIADGLDASTDGRGMTAKHVAAINLANAAPELLAALKDLKADIGRLAWGQPYPGRNHALMDRVDAAIAKAFGNE